MSGDIGSHIVREGDGASVGVWGPFVLRSAFQPIFAFEAGKLSATGFEALLRPFRGPEACTPGAFFGSIPAGERIFVENLSHALHLQNAARFLPASSSIFINFDPSVFTNHAVAEAAIGTMRLVLADTRIDPHRVVCEVTEKETISQEALFVLVESLRANGFRIAVDDYGADDSDIGRIRDLRPDIVKFDAHWTVRLMESGPGYALLSTMVSEFEGQGIRTVFEGIEEGWQLELAEKADVAMVQGFALGRPEIVPGGFSLLAVPGIRDGDKRAASDNLPTQRGAGELRPAKAFGRRALPR